MTVNLITNEELQKLKTELLAEIKILLSELAPGKQKKMAQVLGGQRNNGYFSGHLTKPVYLWPTSRQ